MLTRKECWRTVHRQRAASCVRHFRAERFVMSGSSESCSSVAGECHFRCTREGRKEMWNSVGSGLRRRAGSGLRRRAG
eukprot:2848702-Pleurochrysis_carterae.AAC.1